MSENFNQTNNEEKDFSQGLEHPTEAELEYKPNYEIQRTTIEDALGRSIFDDEQEEYKKLLSEKPGYYAPSQGMADIARDPESKKVVPSDYGQEEIKEGFCWLGVDIDEYFAEYERCAKNPNRIYELADLLHPSMKKMIAEKFLRSENKLSQIPRGELMRYLIGIEHDANPCINFAFEGDDEGMDDFFRNMFKDCREERPDEEATDRIIIPDSELMIPIFRHGRKGVEEGYSGYKGIIYNKGKGRLNLWPPHSLSQIGTEDFKRFKKNLDDIKSLIDKLRQNPQVFQIYFKGGWIPLTPFWKRNEK